MIMSIKFNNYVLLHTQLHFNTKNLEINNNERPIPYRHLTMFDIDNKEKTGLFTFRKIKF